MFGAGTRSRRARDVRAGPAQVRPGLVIPLTPSRGIFCPSRPDIDEPWSRKSFEFRQPIDGRLLAVGGHLHDYGVSLQLEDVRRRKTLVRITTTRDARGRQSFLPTRRTKQTFAPMGGWARIGARDDIGARHDTKVCPAWRNCRARPRALPWQSATATIRPNRQVPKEVEVWLSHP